MRFSKKSKRLVLSLILVIILITTFDFVSHGNNQYQIISDSNLRVERTDSSLTTRFNNWFKENYEGKIAYISTQYFKGYRSVSNIYDSNGSESSKLEREKSDKVKKETLYFATSDLILRVEPDISSEKILVIPKGIHLE